MKLEIASPSLCIQCNITRQIGRPWWNAGPRNFGRIFLIKGVIEGIVAESSTSNLPRRSTFPSVRDVVRTQWNRMGISFINRIFLPDLILAPPAAKHFIALDHKREAKFQIKPSLHLQYYTFISNFSQQLSRGKKRIFPVLEKEKKGKRRNYHTRNVDIISHNDEIILLHEN